MSQSIGSIYVDLSANTGTFVSELSKAAAAAQRATRDMSSDFKRLGDVASQTFGAFGNFNPIISKLSFALESAGNAASSAMKSLSGVGGALGPIAAIGAGAAVGLAAIAAGAIGLAVSSAESAAHLYDLSRATGVSASSFAAWSFAAKQAGLDEQEMARSLEILSANMTKAALAPRGASNVFKTLGLDVRQANGDLKNAGDFMAELLRKLSEMPDKTAAVGLARQALGRGGAQMLQLGDPEEIEHWLAVFKKLNPEFDANAEGARKFEVQMGLLRAEGDSFGNRLMADLIPALDRLVDRLANAFANPSSRIYAWIDGLAKFTTAVMELGNALVFAVREEANFIQANLMPWTLGDRVKDAIAEFKDFKNFTQDLYPSPSAPKAFDIGQAMRDQSHKGLHLPGPAPAPTASREPDIIAKMVETLKAQAAAELAAAAATEKGTAAALLSKAAVEAETKIAEQRASLLEREKTLRGELADARAQEAAGVGSANAAGAGGPGVRALQLEAQISGIQKMRAELEKSAPQIREFLAEIASGQFAVKAGKDLDDLAKKTEEETAASNRMAAAYRQGGQAIVEASAGLKLAPYEKTRAVIGEIISGLEKLPVSADAIAQLRTVFDQLGEGIKRDEIAEKALALSKTTTEINAQTNALLGETEAYRITAAAALASAAAQREAAARAEAVKFAAAHPEVAGGLTPAQVGTTPAAQLPPLLGDVYSDAVKKQNLQRDATVSQLAAQLDLNKSYEKELDDLQRAKAFLEDKGSSAIAIDAKIYQLQISHIEDVQRKTFEAQNEELLGAKKLDDVAQQLTAEWDKAALSVGSIAEKFRAMAYEIEIAGDKLGENVFNSLSKAVDGISGQLAHLIVTGQSSFKKFFEGIAEQQLKSSMQWSFSKILEQITGPKPGDAGKPAPGSIATPPAFAGHVPGPFAAITGALGIKTPSAAVRGPLGTATDPIHVIAAASGALEAGSAAGGSATSPLYSIIADSSGNPFDSANPLPLTPPSKGILTNLAGLTPPAAGGEGSSGAGGASGFFSGIEGMFSKIFSSLSGGLSGIFSGIGSAIGAGGGGVLSGVAGIGKIFAGFLAGGGDAEHGHAYIVGEKGPELFKPDVSGTIIPSFSLMKPPKENDALSSVGQAFDGFRAAGGDVMAGHSYMVGERRPEVFAPSVSAARSLSKEGGMRQTVINFAVNGVQDHDSFRRSQSQIFSNLHAQMELATSRG